MDTTDTTEATTHESKPILPYNHSDTGNSKTGSRTVPSSGESKAVGMNDTIGDDEETQSGTSRGGAANVQKTFPCHCKKGGRNLVVCIDGTGNKFCGENSNVVELYNLLEKGPDVKQHTLYNSGIGTFAKPSRTLKHLKQRISSMLDMAFAWNFEHIVFDSYRWLSDNYLPGDLIFIFGFSRGAYQARVISAMIHVVGLLHKGNEKQIPFAYDLYIHENSEDKRKRGLAYKFKNTFSHDVEVHFVGAWDTVSSIGGARTTELLPETTDGMEHVCHFRHALALDEQRVKFLPEYASGGVSDRYEGQKKRKGTVKEVWFAGAHSDIGGGSFNNQRNPARAHPLRWMAFEAKVAGLRLKPFGSEFLSVEETRISRSLTWPWKILEMLPIKQLDYDQGTTTTRMPHLGEGRKVCRGQKIHGSVLQASRDYSPKADVTALFTCTDGLDFRSRISVCLENPANSHPYIELNNYERARILLMQLFEPRQAAHKVTDANAVHTVPVEGSMSREGIRKTLSYQVGNINDTLAHVLVDMLKAKNSHALDRNFLDALSLHIDETQVQRVQWRRYEDSYLISDLLRPGASTSDQQSANDFLRKLTVPIISTDTSALYCVIFSGDGKRLLSGGQGGVMRIWDAETGEAQGQIETGMEWILSLAASPGNSEFCVIGGHHPDGRNRLQVREAKENGASMATFDYNNGNVLSVGLFGENIVSASDDGNIRIWKRAEGTMAKKFKVLSQSVAFSFNGNKVVSASSQGITIGEVNTKETDLVTLQGSDIDENVFCVAADDNHIVGSSNPTIRVWDASSEEPTQLALLEGHTDIVWSVCFAWNSRKNARFIVSGSDDGLVKVWDAKTYKWRKDLEGHTTGVTSVAFSPDTFRVASADRDGTIMVWECDSF